jgi:hypothetical protein
MESLLTQDIKHLHVIRVGDSPDALPFDSRTSFDYAPFGWGPSRKLLVRLLADITMFVDDDINYPPDYVDRTVEQMIRFGKGACASYHCSYWPKHSTGYGQTEKNGTEHRQCRQYQHGETELYSYPLGGTAVFSFWRHGFLLPTVNEVRMFECESDTLVSAMARSSGMKIVRPTSGEGWLSPMALPGGALWEDAISDGYRKKNACLREAERRFGFKMTDRERFVP